MCISPTWVLPSTRSAGRPKTLLAVCRTLYNDNATPRIAIIYTHLADLTLYACVGSCIASARRVHNRAGRNFGGHREHAIRGGIEAAPRQVKVKTVHANSTATVQCVVLVVPLLESLLEVDNDSGGANACVGMEERRQSVLFSRGDGFAVKCTSKSMFCPIAGGVGIVWPPPMHRVGTLSSFHYATFVILTLSHA